MKKEKATGFLKDFKAFITKGNVLDMAVGVIIGSAFTAIVTSLNVDILSPFLGLIGGTDFTNKFIQLTGDVDYATLAEAKEAGCAVFAWGSFITAIINFLITAFAVFVLVRIITKVTNKLKKPAAPAAPTTKKCPYCLSEIPLEATRCPHCTSMLNEKQDK